MSNNLQDHLDRINGLQDKEVKVGGMKMTPTTIGAAFAMISTVVGMLYGGFVMYQKVEELATLDLGAYQQQMEVMDARVEEALSYSRDIKNGLKDDILRIEQQTDRTEDMVRDMEADVRTMIDDAETRFETKRDQLRSSQALDLKELEDRLTARIQRALDNPLAD